MRLIHTSESVSEGHPDKVADQISDALLDSFLHGDGKNPGDSDSRVAVETMLAHGVAIVSGEVRTRTYVDVQSVVRETIKSIGYTDTRVGFDGGSCGVLVAIQPQSPDIARGVDTGGAGDQGMMFGMATDETASLMPLPITIAQAIMKKAAQVRREDPSLGLRPDAKAQVSIGYEQGRPRHIETIVVSHQHDEGITQQSMKSRLMEHIVAPVLQEYCDHVGPDPQFHVNPTGVFVLGGPAADTGLTGRKIIADTYGGLCPHGGGAFSGKDPTKVDRSAAYMARHVSKCIVAAGLAKRCQVAVAYAIGVKEPVSFYVETFGTETVAPEKISQRVTERFDMSPAGIVAHLKLKETRYLPTARCGHFGDPAFSWESTDPAADLANGL